eukprot:COSAG02_NODE_3553_length_6571_cov_3.989957_3_plen_137_part_00
MQARSRRSMFDYGDRSAPARESSEFPAAAAVVVVARGAAAARERRSRSVRAPGRLGFRRSSASIRAVAPPACCISKAPRVSPRTDDGQAGPVQLSAVRCVHGGGECWHPATHTITGAARLDTKLGAVALHDRDAVQ